MRKKKPTAAITRLTESDVEDFIIENSPEIREKIVKAEAEIKAGQVITLDSYLLNLKK